MLNIKWWQARAEFWLLLWAPTAALVGVVTVGTLNAFMPLAEGHFAHGLEFLAAIAAPGLVGLSRRWLRAIGDITVAASENSPLAAGSE